MKHMSQSVHASTTGFRSLAVDRIEFTGLRFVDQVEQAREGIAQVEAAPAGVTDVEHTAQFGVDRGGVVEAVFLPGNRVACRRLEAAFSHAVCTLALGDWEEPVIPANTRAQDGRISGPWAPAFAGLTLRPSP
ncbi:MAG: hypothetical protein WDN25_21830 [Acetobacteraceae bacterium]